jgi:hypothetical protein
MSEGISETHWILAASKSTKGAFSRTRQTYFLKAHRRESIGKTNFGTHFLKAPPLIRTWLRTLLHLS